ncbi:MAG: hypothetical protein JNL10_14460 [Verrucomicrobiales bacterium]|nr:hypothetical protein [Verrucomicrobiales bacterium]
MIGFVLRVSWLITAVLLVATECCGAENAGTDAAGPRATTTRSSFGVTLGTTVLVPSAVTAAQLSAVSNRIASAGGVGSRVIEIPALYGDAPDGTPNSQDPTEFIQGYIDKASAQYSESEGRVRLVFPPVTWSHRELILKPNVIYQAVGETVFTPRYDSPPGMADRSLWRTRRVDGIRVDPVTGGFDGWRLPNPDDWYGLSRNMAFVGPGRFILDVRQKRRTQSALQWNEVENLYVEHGVIEVRHGPNAVHWAVRMGGRDVYWEHPIIRNGLLTGQDGVHVTHGHGILIRGGDIQSGDDCFAFGQEYAGGSNVGPDEPLSDVYVTGAACDSRRARAIICYSGLNYIGVTHRHAQRVRRVLAEGLTGHVAKDRQCAVWMGYYPARDAIWRYEITRPGRGYRDGYYTNLPVTGGGGSGARCAVRVVDSQVDRAWIYQDRTANPPTFRVGSRYVADGLVDLSSLPDGSGAVVVAKYTPVPNDRVEDVDVTFQGQMGGVSHDGESAYGLALEGCRRVGLHLELSVVENETKPEHHPFLITAAEDSRIQLILKTPVARSGIINSGVFPGQVVDGVTFDGCSFTGTPRLEGGVIKFLGSNGTVRVVGSRFERIPPDRAAFYAPEVESRRTNRLELLEVVGSTFSSLAPPPRNSFVLDLVNSALGGQIERLEMSSNRFENMRWDSQEQWSRGIARWRLRDNAGHPDQSR